MSFLRTLSINSARYPELPVNLITETGCEQIVCHTSRSFYLIPSACKRLVAHIDLCDDLVSAYSRMALQCLAQLRLLSCGIFSWEALRELQLWRISRKVPVSFITQPQFFRGAFEIIPNFHGGKQLALPEYSFRVRKPVFGILGNFRTMANQSCVKWSLKNITPLGYRVILFGNNANIFENKAGLGIYGTFATRSEIQEHFDIGLCVVDLQGGIQNKVIDYLILGKPTIVSENVMQALRDSPGYFLLSESPLLFLTSQVDLAINAVGRKELFENNRELVRKFLMTLNDESL